MRTNTYAYDPIGNRLSAVSDVGLVVSTNNYLSNIVASGVSPESPTYAAADNMLTHGDWTFTWNGENRLINATDGATTISNSYDYMGRRFSKETRNSELGTTNRTEFTYDGWNMICEQVERDSSPAQTNYYTYGLDLSGSMQGAGGIGDLLSISVASGVSPDPQTAFYCYDANGNVTDLVDTNGTTVAHYEYGPFGQTTAKTGTLADANPFRFSTKCLDDELGWYYYGYRYYSPLLGRFVNRDPVREKGAQVIWVRFYASRSYRRFAAPNLQKFTANNPLNGVDVLGLLTKSGCADAAKAHARLVQRVVSEYQYHFRGRCCLKWKEEIR